jgi:hypothetical protein
MKAKEAIAMVAAHNLLENTEETHRLLTASLDDAAAMENVPGQPRKGFERADTFLSATSRHLNAVETVVLPVAQRRVDDADTLVHDYVAACKDLETALFNAKSREYGSAYAITMRWDEIWSSVRERLDQQHRLERDLAEVLSAELDDTEENDLVDLLHEVEPDACSRPHPHAPHLGAKGRIARRLLHAVDSFWDTAESRMVPERERPPRKKPGLMTQYLLADPRFDEDE